MTEEEIFIELETIEEELRALNATSARLIDQINDLTEIKKHAAEKQRLADARGELAPETIDALGSETKIRRLTQKLNIATAPREELERRVYGLARKRTAIPLKQLETDLRASGVALARLWVEYQVRSAHSGRAARGELAFPPVINRFDTADVRREIEREVQREQDEILSVLDRV